MINDKINDIKIKALQNVLYTNFKLAASQLCPSLRISRTASAEMKKLAAVPGVPSSAVQRR